MSASEAAAARAPLAKQLIGPQPPGESSDADLCIGGAKGKAVEELSHDSFENALGQLKRLFGLKKEESCCRALESDQELDRFQRKLTCFAPSTG